MKIGIDGGLVPKEVCSEIRFETSEGSRRAICTSDDAFDIDPLSQEASGWSWWLEKMQDRMGEFKEEE